MHLLLYVAVVAEDTVVQVIERVLHPRAQVSIHPPAGIRETVLRTRNGGDIARVAVGIGVVVRAEITIAVDMLKRGIDAYKVLIIRRVVIPFQRCGVDVMLQLLGQRRLMRLQAVDTIAAAALLGRMVVFCSQFGIVGRLEE